MICPVVAPNTLCENRIIYMKTKMKLIASVKIWIAIYPSITLFLYLFWRSFIRAATVSKNIIT